MSKSRIETTRSEFRGAIAKRAGRAGWEADVGAGLDPKRESETLVALAMHLDTEMLLDLPTAESALGLIDYHIRRALPGVNESSMASPTLS